MENQNEPLYGGLHVSRSLPMLGRTAEPSVSFGGIQLKEWVAKRHFRMASFTNAYYTNGGEEDVILLEPLGVAKERDVLESLGVKILHDHPSWYGFKMPGDRTVVDGLRDWIDDVIAQYKTQLVQAEILGAIVAFRGSYDKNPKLFKGLVELWCSETNTFHLPYGEIGISLWEIKVLSGLSITGEIYDEFVPSNSELKDYPCNLRQLLNAYEWLVNRGSGKAIYYNHWVDFWYRGPRKSTSRLRKDSINEEERKKAPTYSEDGYLAAFLTLWLCKFVMPFGKKDIIRPETFIMASQMAHGMKVALVPAVLCAIQVALGRMVSDPRGPTYSCCRFPIDFLFAWVGAHFEKVYVRRPIRKDIKDMPGLKKVPDMISFMGAMATPFESRRARQHLRDERNFIWRPYSFDCSGEGWIHEVIDMRGKSDFPEGVREWVISLRHSILPLRLNGGLHAQPYNPHRFARQFGFDQHFPKSFDVPREVASTGVLAGYWLDLTTINPSWKFFIPDGNRLGKPSSHYARWWTNSLYSYFQHGVNFLVERESCPKKKNESPLKKVVQPQLSFELSDSTKTKVFSAPYDYVERHHIREGSEERPSVLHVGIQVEGVTPEPAGVGNCPGLKRRRSPDASTSGSKKSNVGELPIAICIANELPSPTPEDAVSPIVFEQALPPHYDDEVDYEPSPSPPPIEGKDVIVEETIEGNIIREEIVANLTPEGVAGKDAPLAKNIPREVVQNLDSSTLEYVGSTLLGQVIDIIRTSSYKNYRTIQERISSHCRSLSTFGIDTTGLETRLQRLFDGATAIEEVIALPAFSSSARLVKAEENLDMKEKALEACFSSENSFRRNLEHYSSEFARQEGEIADLEKTLSEKKAANAMLLEQMNVAKDCLQGLDSTKEQIAKDAAEAERELMEAQESHTATEELATLRDLIRSFESYRKEF